MAALVAAQLLGVAPARAAELGDDRIVTQQRGTFAGARVRMPFGGEDSGKVRAGLSLTSMNRSDLVGGPSRTSFAQGAELRLSSREAPKLHLGGTPLSQRLAAAQSGDGRREKGSSLGNKVLKGGAILLIIGAVVVIGLGVALFAHCETTTQCDD